MKILATRHFARWAKKQGLTNESLERAAQQVMLGQYEANLGSQLIKKRVALANNHFFSNAFTTVVCPRLQEK